MVKEALVTLGWTLRDHKYLVAAGMFLALVLPGIVRLAIMLPKG